MTAPSFLEASAACYGTILDDFSVIACAHEFENELGAAAFATRSVLAPLPSGSFRQDRLKHAVHAFSYEKEVSVFRTDGAELTNYATWLAKSSRVLHEGYMVDPAEEASKDLEKLRDVIGPKLWAASPTTWRAWGNKASFRQRCKEILGVESVPLGIEFVANEATDIHNAVKSFEPDVAGDRIVKLPGVGGQGNLVLTPAASDSWDRDVASLWDRRAVGPLDVVVEHWLPWESTYSASVLVSPGGLQQHIAVCEQHVDASGRFIGSRNDLRLSTADTESMLTWLSPLFEALGRDGYAGVAAFDVVVGSPHLWRGHGYQLPSGQRACVIECNPRFNRHNRVGLVVERLARNWGLDSSTLRWILRDIYPSKGVILSDLVQELWSTSPSLLMGPNAPRPGTLTRMNFTDRRERVMELSVTRTE